MKMTEIVQEISSNLKKNEITFCNPSKVISRSTIAKFSNLHISPWIGHHATPPPPPPLPNLQLSFDMYKT